MKILIVNGHQKWEQFSEGTLHKSINDFLNEKLNHHELQNSDINSYIVEEEVDKFVWADMIIYHFPIFWMSVPWKMKKYIEEVLMSGGGKLFQNDGRTRENPDNLNYGKGGLCINKKMMMISSMNAPKEAFDSNEFFQGDFNKLLHWFILNHKWIGFSKSEKSFVFHDVVKNPNIENDFKQLDKIISRL